MRDNARFTADTSALLNRAPEDDGKSNQKHCTHCGRRKDEVDRDEAKLLQMRPLPLLPGRQKLKMLPRKKLTRTMCVS